jgi:energy-coupling factor transporter ATP-binding protein EcfA2
MVFQDADCQIVTETVAEDLAFGPRTGTTTKGVASRVNRALQALDIQDSPLCHRLSGGEKRRVAIADVLAMEPQVIVFDEPFANLDSGVQSSSRNDQTRRRTHSRGHHARRRRS